MASEIRVDKINSLSGVGTVTLSPTGVDIAGITTATTFVGALTGNVTGTASGNAVLTGSTNNTLVTVTGANAITGESTLTYDGTNLDLGADNKKLRLGGGNDIELYTDGSHSYLNNENGNWYIHGSTGSNSQEILIRPKQGEQSIRAIADGAVELYHNSSKKLDTDSEGISVTGTVKINNTSSVGDYNGGADDMLIGTHSGNHGITILSGTTNGGYIMFSDNNGGGVNAYRGQIEYAHSSDYMRFMTDSGERVRILSGGGITFNGDTATANALDDYEEGTWTPSNSTVGFVSGSTAEGHYTKVGDLVYASAICRIETNGSAIQLHIDGLPFTAKDGSSGSYIQGGFVTYANQGNDAFVLIANNGTRVFFFQTSGSDWQLTNWDNAHLRFTVIYKTA